MTKPVNPNEESHSQDAQQVEFIESLPLAQTAVQIAETLDNILGELKEINISLKSIARSQAQQATVQKRTS